MRQKILIMNTLNLKLHFLGWFKKWTIFIWGLLCLLCVNDIRAQNQNALNFDGSNDYVYVAPDRGFDFGTEGFTVETHVRIEKGKATGNRVIVSNCPPDDVSKGFLVFILNHKLHVQIREYFFTATNSPDIDDGNWKCIAVIRNKDTLRAYINGLPYTFAVSGLVSADVTTNAGILIGRYAANPSPFVGSIDELRIWNRTLSPGELSCNTCGISSPQPGLQLYYKFNQGVAGGNNTNVVGVADSSYSSMFPKDGELVNFSLSDSTSNFVAGLPCATTGIDEVKAIAENSVRILPNPATDWLAVKYQLTKSEKVIISLYSMNGTQILQKEIGFKQPGAHEDRMELREIPAGSYIVKLEAGSSITTSPAIIAGRAGK